MTDGIWSVKYTDVIGSMAKQAKPEKTSVRSRIVGFLIGYYRDVTQRLEVGGGLGVRAFFKQPSQICMSSRKRVSRRPP
jgi:hypothetical protein